MGGLTFFRFARTEVVREMTKPLPVKDTTPNTPYI